MSVGLTELSLMFFSELKAETSYWINPHIVIQIPNIKYEYWIIMIKYAVLCFNWYISLKITLLCKCVISTSATVSQYQYSFCAAGIQCTGKCRGITAGCRIIIWCVSSPQCQTVIQLLEVTGDAIKKLEYKKKCIK